jgi:VWFA-related protein
MTTRSEPATFRARTNEVEVPVVARDGKGRAVGGLRDTDFRLFDRGKRQTISRVTALNRGTESSGEPERFTVYVLADVGGWEIRFREAAIHHMQTALTPEDRAAILSTSGRYALDFTDHPAKLVETLRRFQLSQFVPTHPRMSVEEISNLLQNLGGQTLEALRNAVRRLSAMPGQRRVVLASPGFLTSDLVLPIIPPISFHVMLRPEMENVLAEAIRARVVINCLQPEGLTTPIDILGIRTALQRALGELSQGTGGIFFKDNNDLEEGLRRMVTIPEHSYILAFSPQNLKYDGGFHELKVTVPGRKGVDIQARAGYLAPRRLDDPVETAREEIREALFSRDEIDELPSDLHSGFMRLSAEKARVNLQIHVGLGPLHFRKADGRNSAELTVMAGLFDRNGGYAGGRQIEVELHLKDENFEQWMRNGIKFGCSLDAAPGSYRVRLVVRDSEGRAMAAHNAAVEIP